MVNSHDHRDMARRRLPAGVFAYIDGGAEDERTMAANEAAFGRVTFRPRVLAGLDSVRVSTALLGVDARLPLVLAPTGFTRMAHSQGELSVARAAARAGVPYTLSTMSTRSIEEVRAVSDGRLWFQVYLWRDRGLVRDMVERAARADYEALVLTVDTAVIGRRERDIRLGFALPPTIGPRTLLDGVRHPSWTMDFIRSEPIRFANVIGSTVDDGASPVALSEYVSGQFDASLSWADVEWLRSIWEGPILVKGIQRTDDAVIAAELGIHGIVVSNHGGRQLDGAPATLDLVAPIADLVGGQTEIYVDGGVRRGADIVKAIALGASGVLIGRPYLYALAAAGEAGVDQLLSWLRADVKRTMHLIGAPEVAALDRSCVTF